MLQPDLRRRSDRVQRQGAGGEAHKQLRRRHGQLQGDSGNEHQWNFTHLCFLRYLHPMLYYFRFELI